MICERPWLSEAAGSTCLHSSSTSARGVAGIRQFEGGQRFVIAGAPWTVFNIEHAECIAGQGELPFKVGAGYPVNTVDLRGVPAGAVLPAGLLRRHRRCCLLASRSFKSLKMNNPARGACLADGKASLRRCSAVRPCGSPMQAQGQDIVAAGCASCGAVVDTSDENYKLILKAMGQRDEKYKPRACRWAARERLKASRWGDGSRQADQVEGIVRLARYLLASEHERLPLADRIQRALEHRRRAVASAGTSGAMELADVAWVARNSSISRPPPRRRWIAGRRRIHLARAARRNQRMKGGHVRGTAVDAVP